MRKRAEVFTGKEMDTQSSYSMMEDSGELAHGTISFYHQMMDGSVCVAVYSTAYDDLYDMYKLDDMKEARQQIRDKKRAVGERGVRYQEIK